MKIILKPAGVAVVLLAFGVLAFVAVPRKTAPQKNAVAPIASRTNATPTDAESLRTSGGPELSVRSSATVDWKKSTRILEPNITGTTWRQLVGAGNMTTRVVPSSVVGHAFARQLSIQTLGKNSWDLQIAHPLQVAFKKGSHVRLTYWARSKDGCKVAAVVEQATEPYTKIATRIAELTPEWKQYAEEWEPTADTEPGWAHINFQVGYKTGALELTGVQLDEVR